MAIVPIITTARAKAVGIPAAPATSGAPTDSPPAGTIRFDTATNKLWIYNGAAWKSVTLT